MKRVAWVTGAAGFIGSHLVDSLLEQDCFVIGIDNLKLGRRSNLQQALTSPRFAFIEGDVNQTKHYLASLKGHTFGPITEVWHMAANSDISAGVADPQIDLRDTFITTFQALQVMQALGVKQLAFASSSAIYGEHEAVLQEDTGPLFPASNYGAMKLASEAIIAAASQQFIEQAWIFRFPNVIGPRATHGVIYDFVRKLQANRRSLQVLGDGTQEKPYLHVSELLAAMLHCRACSHEKINCFNIGVSDSATTVRYIAEKVVSTVSPGAEIHYGQGNRGWVGDVPRFRYSTRKLNALGFTPQLTSNQAIDLAINEITQELLGSEQS